jgi:hypothetical protein
MLPVPPIQLPDSAPNPFQASGASHQWTTHSPPARRRTMPAVPSSITRPPPHDAHRRADVDPEQQQHDDHRQPVAAQQVVGRRLRRQHADVAQHQGGGVDPDQRHDELEQLPAGETLHPEPESGHTRQHGHDGNRMK